MSRRMVPLLNPLGDFEALKQKLIADGRPICGLLFVAVVPSEKSKEVGGEILYEPNLLVAYVPKEDPEMVRFMAEQASWIVQHEVLDGNHRKGGDRDEGESGAEATDEASRSALAAAGDDVEHGGGGGE